MVEKITLLDTNMAASIEASLKATYEQKMESARHRIYSSRRPRSSNRKDDRPLVEKEKDADDMTPLDFEDRFNKNIVREHYYRNKYINDHTEGILKRKEIGGFKYDTE